jgi:DNA-binding transcriptional MerR regulator
VKGTVEALNKYLGITHISTGGYNARANAVVERFMQTLNAMLRTCDDKTYKDIKNLRILNFSEREIKDIIKARRAVSKQDLSSLMTGFFNSEGYVDTLKNKKGGLQAALKNLNRTLGTFYTVNDLIDREALSDIKKKYDTIIYYDVLEHIKNDLKEISKRIVDLEKWLKNCIGLLITCRPSLSNTW